MVRARHLLNFDHVRCRLRLLLPKVEFVLVWWVSRLHMFKLKHSADVNSKTRTKGRLREGIGEDFMLWLIWREERMTMMSSQETRLYPIEKLEVFNVICRMRPIKKQNKTPKTCNLCFWTLSFFR